MVKGISRQVILVPSPDQKLFEQAIFILKDSAVEEGITDEVLMKEARQAIRGRVVQEKKGLRFFWAAAGALATGLVWLATAFF